MADTLQIALTATDDQLVKQIDAIADQEDRSRSQMARILLREALEARNVVSTKK